MFHESHATIFRPALFVIIPNNIFIVRIWVFSQESLHQLSRFISYEFENNVDVVNITHVHSDGVAGLDLDGFEKHELVLILWRAGEL